MKNSISAILIMVLCTAFTSAGQVLWKLSMDNMSEITFLSIITNYYLIAGFVSYGLGAVLLIFALRKGELSVLYPIVATSYIWVSLLSMRFLGESISLFKWIGICIIMVGVVIVQIPSRKEVKEIGN
jgi:uncharacterized membrane protein